jgi:hypothetical protein
MPDRKYRQKGYQDSARSSRSDGPSGGFPGRLEGGPRGRGSETNRAEVFRCKGCGEKADPEFGPEAACKKCGAALHSCVQCRHFDTAAPRQCRQPIPAPLPSKSAQNACALFEAILVADLTGTKAGGTTGGTPDQARSAFDKLFDKK